MWVETSRASAAARSVDRCQVSDAVGRTVPNHSEAATAAGVQVPDVGWEAARGWAQGEGRAIRLVHFSVQGNHMHLIAEAPDEVRLSRGLQGLAVRIARGVNRVMGRTGKVFADRYHEHVLRSGAEVANAVAYVLGNLARHALRRGARVVEGMTDPCSSRARDNALLTKSPLTWLLRRFGPS